MFWRREPGNSVGILSDPSWPRDGAILRGKALKMPNGEFWLEASHVQQPHSDEWIAAPKGAYMPFEHQGHYYLGQV